MDRHSDTLERLTPGDVRAGQTTGDEALRLHLERYEFAAAHARAGRLLDIACGVGYGTRLLSDQCDALTCALGVDLSPETIAYTKKHYGNRRTRFVAADAMTFEDPDAFDTIVTLETIEHLPNPGDFVDRLIRLLRPSGILIASVPVTPSMDANPHHLHDFTEKSFRQLFVRRDLIETGSLIQIQPFKLTEVIKKRESRMQHIRRNLPAYYLSHPGSLLRRVWSTLRYGFTNRYVTIVWQVPR